VDTNIYGFKSNVEMNNPMYQPQPSNFNITNPTARYEDLTPRKRTQV